MPSLFVEVESRDRLAPSSEAAFRIAAFVVERSHDALMISMLSNDTF